MDLFQEPDYEADKRNLEFAVRAFYHEVTNGKRLTVDPFLEKSQVRCVDCKSKTRYEIPSLDDLESGKIIKFVALMINNSKQHLCMLNKLKINILNNGLGSGPPNCCAFGEFVFCYNCGETAPLRAPLMTQSRWKHVCPMRITGLRDGNWGLDIGKKNTLEFVVQKWVLDINFDHKLWMKLKIKCHERPTEMSYDAKAVAFLFTDQMLNDVNSYCQADPPPGARFRFIPKPQPRQAGTQSGRASSAGPQPGNARSMMMANSRKGLAALTMLQAIPPEVMKKVYRTIALEMHPDKHPDNPAEWDLAFRKFQEKWNLWTKI